MRKSIHVILALIVGIVIGTSSDVFAATKQYVQAYFSKYTFVVNGQEVELSADPLVYQDSTYLPLRAVLNTLGYDVGYKADTRTITADKSPETMLQEANQLLKPTIGGAELSADEIQQKLSVENSMMLTAKSMLARETAELEPDPSILEKLESYITEHTAIIADLEAQLAELQK